MGAMVPVDLCIEDASFSYLGGEGRLAFGASQLAILDSPLGAECRGLLRYKRLEHYK